MIKNIIVCALISSASFAHTAIMSCFDNGDNTITCEGGFSDGSSASGVAFRIEQNGSVTFDTRLSEYSDVTFNRPNGKYVVVFDAGEGHQILIDGSDIIE